MGIQKNVGASEMSEIIKTLELELKIMVREGEKKKKKKKTQPMGE